MKQLNYAIDNKFDKTITLPGSKYLANRLLILAALSESDSTLSNMPHNEDIDTSIAGLSLLGATFQWSGDQLSCSGCNLADNPLNLSINSSASGSFSRFVMPLLALSKNKISLSGTDKMNSRPMEELFRVLEQLGADIRSKTQSPAMTLPIEVSGPIKGGRINMSGSTSSQYISALLMVAGKLSEGLEINLTASPVSKPYLLMTMDLLKSFGIIIEASDDLMRFSINPGQRYQGVDYQLESDPSSASYFLAAAAITAGHICITNFNPERSIQGEAQFAKVLENMGCKIWQDKQGYHCQGPEVLKAVTVDMGDMPDVAQTLAVVAAFAQGTTIITNVENLAFKESNRIEDTATEIRKTGIKVSTTLDSISIDGGCPTNATFDTYDDHRMAMSLALFALKVEGIKMNDTEVVGKSFPTYWQYLEQLGYALTEKH